VFKKVVWATDGSEGSDQALGLAKQLATEGGGELLAVHCTELTMPYKGGASVPVHAKEEELREKIQHQVSELNEGDLSATVEMVMTGVGGAAHAIAEAAHNANADVIVLGTRGHTALAGLLLGSVTQRLLHIASCPVLAVPRTGTDRNG
jgi:nucleotide-binding universal stress UspA family protein